MDCLQIISQYCPIPPPSLPSPSLPPSLSPLSLSLPLSPVMAQISILQIHVSRGDELHSMDDLDFCFDDDENDSKSCSFKDDLMKNLFDDETCPLNQRGLVVANGYHLSSTPGASQDEV